MTRSTLGEFEQLVLLALLHLGEDAYGAPIVHLIEERTGRSAASAAVYIALKRLEKKGLVKSELGESTPERSGRAKRYYRIKPSALRQLSESRSALLGMWAGVEHLAEESR